MLEAELAAGGLDQPLALSGLLAALGLQLMHDARRLNKPEQLELAGSLKAADVNLGSRSKLCLLAANVRGVADHDLDLVAAISNTKAPRRQLQDQPPTAAASGTDSGPGVLAPATSVASRACTLSP